MNFWNSKLHKARKQHTCMYCGKRIEVKEKYYRESGCIDGYMEDYCLCERCKQALPYTKISCETNDLGNLLDDIVDADMLACPICGSCTLDAYGLNGDCSRAICACENDHGYAVDLSYESIRDYFVKRNEEEKAHRKHLEELRKARKL